MTMPIYEDPIGHRVYDGPSPEVSDVNYPPHGCGVCGVARRRHFGRWNVLYGWHGWRAPSSAQIKQRMLARRAQKQARRDRLSVSTPIGRIPLVSTMKMADMSSLAPLVPDDGIQVLGFYIGGNTPEEPTLVQARDVGARYWLPIYTRSDPEQVSVQQDIDSALNHLGRLGAPAKITIALDLETAVDAAWVKAFSDGLNAHLYYVMAYGSKSSLFRNPEPVGGYWVADYTGQSHLYPGTVATQYASSTMAGRPYDLSTISSAVPLWDTVNDGYAGSTGDSHVAVLQEELNALGASLAVDGDKGPLTKKAFTEVMARYGTIQQGDTGVPVKAVQAMLNTWGTVVTEAALAVDGRFGENTKTNTVTFQTSRKVQGGYNGQVGPYTKAALAV